MKEKNSKLKIFVSCGEMSGDLHLSYIIEEMKKKNENLEFYGVVGDNSIRVGAFEIGHIKENDIMGFIEVFNKYKYFKKKILEYVEYIEKNDIRIVIFVDFGGFNLKFFEILKRKIPNIKTIYYIPPKVWAWGKNRLNKLKNFDDVIVIFPFEKKYFDENVNKNELEVKYFGNPLVDKYLFCRKIGEKILLLPGSRSQEIKKFIPILINMIEKTEMKKEKFLLKLAHESHLKYIEELENKFKFDIKKYKNLEITFDKLEDLRENCKYAIATSGTVTFELALMGLPTIVVYKTSKFNAFIAKNILKIKYITLININSKKEIFPELVQEKFNENNLLLECEKMEINKIKINLELQKERIKIGEKKVLDKIVNYLISRIH